MLDTIKAFLPILADIGLGASALFLASKLTMTVQDHGRRITVLERKAA